MCDDRLVGDCFGFDGVGLVLRCRGTIGDAGGSVKIVLDGEARDLFTFMELYKMFELHEDVEGALERYAA